MTYDEYLTNIAIPFREYLAGGGDVDEYPGGWVYVDCDVICHAQSCPRNGQVIRLAISENFNGVYSSFCGTCMEGPIGDDGQTMNTPYTDITFWGYQGVQFTV